MGRIQSLYDNCQELSKNLLSTKKCSNLCSVIKMNKNEIVKQMIAVAKEAGAFILNREVLRVDQKGDVANIVTNMDIAAQELILSRLTTILPEAKVIAEENNTFAFDEGYVWVVDPIDGTTNYAYDCKFSCVSIALLHEKAGYLGVVYNPYLDELFVGIKGEGSTLNGKSIHVNETKLKSSLIVVGTSPYAKEKANLTFDNLKKLFIYGRDIRRSGSAVLDLCYVACGRYDAFYEASLAPWDFSAASLIIQEAGGLVGTTKEEIWGYEKSIPLIAGNEQNFHAIHTLIQ